jgi:CubicO group peptidase (beta-lactamase class C family)
VARQSKDGEANRDEPGIRTLVRTSTPPARGPEVPLLPQTAAHVNTLVAQAQSRGRVPVLVAGVVRDGQLVHVTASPEPDPTRNPGDVQFRIGSITKTMTAALVLRLRDEGQLALDDLLYRHLPGTPVGGITLRQLLGHHSGLQREPDGPWWERTAGADLDTFLAELTPDKVAYPPQRGFHYSNLAYGLLGAVVTRLSGEDWTSLLGKRLLEPLGMSRTTYDPVQPYAPGFVVHPWLDTMREEPRLDAGAMAPAGQLWSTVADLAKWAAFLASPDPAVLAADSLTEMCAPVVMSDPETWTMGHGLGLRLWRHGERVYVGHSGSMPGYLATLAVHRASGTGVVAFANGYTLHGGGIADLGLDLLTGVLDREPARVTPWKPTAAPPPASVEPLTGRWWWMGQEHEASWDGGLVITPVTVPREPWRFEPDSTDRWCGRSGENDGELLLVRRERGEPIALDLATAVLTRDPWPAETRRKLSPKP